MILPRNSAALALASLVNTASSLATYSPGPKYSLGLPPSTVSSGSGDIYFQLSAPDTYQWVGLGIGQEMAGANIFVMYTDGTGNVTISARNGGAGHVEPQVDNTLDVVLLEGSGVVGGNIIANVKCTNCASKLSSTTTTSSNWIAAWNLGSAIDSTSDSYVLNQHSLNNHESFTFDLTAATISSDTNPFISASSASPTSPTSGTASGSIPAETGSSSSGSSTISQTNVFDYDKAHGIIMGVTVVLLFPIGALFMRLVGNAMLHAVLQIFSLLALIVGFGLGVKLAHLKFYLWNNAHTRFGLALFILFLIQPVIGLIHHRSYLRTQKRGIFGQIHTWYGRALLILGVINGGLGLQLAANTRGGEIAYGVVAGVMAIFYLFVIGVVGFRKGKGGGKVERGEETTELGPVGRR